MAENKQSTTTAKKKDHWFSLSGIKKEAKRVRWPKWKSEGSTDGVGRTTGEVLIFTGFFAAYFVFCDFIVTWILKLMGIGA